MLKTTMKALAAGTMLAGSATVAAAEEPYNVFLSMSYIGNDWQSEAANMVKALAAHPEYADRVCPSSEFLGQLAA